MGPTRSRAPDNRCEAGRIVRVDTPPSAPALVTALVTLQPLPALSSPRLARGALGTGGIPSSPSQLVPVAGDASRIVSIRGGAPACWEEAQEPALRTGWRSEGRRDGGFRSVGSSSSCHEEGTTLRDEWSESEVGVLAPGAEVVSETPRSRFHCSQGFCEVVRVEDGVGSDLRSMRR